MSLAVGDPRPTRASQPEPPPAAGSAPAPTGQALDAAPAGLEPAPADVELKPGAVHVWLADLATVGDGVLSLLDASERSRAASILDQRLRLRWSRSRGLLRELIGRYIGRDPRALAFALGVNGKPALRVLGDSGAAAPLSFNLSHSRGLALYAFAFQELGVDLQLAPERRRPDFLAIARRSFGTEVAQRLERLAAVDREREFLRLWTRYEAELKRRGEGIGAGRASHRPGGWIADLDLGPGLAGAIACAGEPRELRIWRWAKPGSGSD